MNTVTRRRKVVIASIAILLVILELVCRVYLERIYKPVLTFPYSEVTGKQYGQGNWWSREYVGEIQRAFNIFDGDYHSRYINFTHGLRDTANAPATYHHTVYLVGNSALVNGETPDAYTVASLLQARLTDWRVVNLSQNGLSAAADIIILEDLQAGSGDTVVYYHGGLEAYGVWNAADGERGTRPTDGPCNVALHYLSLAVVKLLCWQAQFDAPGLHDERLIIYAQDAALAYQRSIDKARTIVERRGARFVNILQPYCLCSAISDYASVDRAFMAFYDAARASVDNTLDWSHLLNEANFYAPLHTTPDGNAAIAQALYQVIIF